MKLSCLNQFLQQKVKLLSPDVYAHVHPIIKGWLLSRKWECSSSKTTCIVPRELVENNDQPSDSTYSEKGIKYLF